MSAYQDQLADRTAQILAAQAAGAPNVLNPDGTMKSLDEIVAANQVAANAGAEDDETSAQA